MAQKKKLLIIILAAFLSFCFLVFAAVCVINAVVIGSAKDNIREISHGDGYDTAVVFGAKVHPGGTLSHMLQDRMDTAIALYKSGSIKTLLLSGDGSGEWSEVVYMKKRVVSMILALMLISQQAHASILGSLITGWSHEIANGTEFYKNTFISDQSGVGKQAEYYAEYVPNEKVVHLQNVIEG